MTNWKLAQFTTIESVSPDNALFFVASRRRWNRWRVTSTRNNFEVGFYVSPRNDAPLAVGDAPDKLHPLYLAAIIASESASGDAMEKKTVALPDTSIPPVSFVTNEAIRRSMTLNGMRMSTEYFANGSLRVLELIENRLALGQSDVVHNVLVYLMRRVFDIQAEADEARDLKAEALSAFLGVDQNATRILLSSTRPSAQRVAQQILAHEAGTVRRKISDDAVHLLVQNQMKILLAQLRDSSREEEHVLRLTDHIAARLFSYEH